MTGSRHRYLQAFQAADKDKSGSLDRSELAAALNSQGIPESEIDVCILVYLLVLYTKKA